MTDRQRYERAVKDYRYIEDTYGAPLDNAGTHEQLYFMVFRRGGYSLSYSGLCDLVIGELRAFFAVGCIDDKDNRAELPADTDARLQEIRDRWSV